MYRLMVFALGMLIAATAPVVCAAGAALTDLKPGVSSVDAFMAREPAPPASGDQARQLQPLVAELGRRLDAEDTLLGECANRLGKQAMPAGVAGGDGNAASVAQAMAMAKRMQAGGGIQAMMMVARFNSDAQHQAHLKLYLQRVQEGETALDQAGSWLKAARSRLNAKLDAALKGCPMRQLGELRERAPSCVRSAKLAYQQKTRHLAVAYLSKVADPLDNALTATKVLVDEQQEFAKKLSAVGRGSFVEGQVATMEGLSIRDIWTYHRRLLAPAVAVAADLAAFKVDLGA